MKIQSIPNNIIKSKFVSPKIALGAALLASITSFAACNNNQGDKFERKQTVQLQSQDNVLSQTKAPVSYIDGKPVVNATYNPKNPRHQQEKEDYLKMKAIQNEWLSQSDAKNIDEAIADLSVEVTQDEIVAKNGKFESPAEKENFDRELRAKKELLKDAIWNKSLKDEREKAEAEVKIINPTFEKEESSDQKEEPTISA